MKLSLSVAAQNPRFAKSIRRVRPAFDSFVDAFSRVEMDNPIHEALLIGLTDAKSEEYFEIIPNNDGFFQILSGIKKDAIEQELEAAIFNVIRRAVSVCPFSLPDKEKFATLLSSWGK